MPDKNEMVSIGGSVERALKGDYVIDVKAILAEAWQQTLKTRMSINISLLFVFLLGMSAFYFTSSFVGGAESVFADQKLFMLLNIIVTVVIFPFIAGIEMMGLAHAIGKVTQVKMFFSYLHRGSWVVLCALMTSIFTNIGLQLFIIPGVFLMVVLSPTILLVVDKNYSPWQAIVLSVQALRFKFFQLLNIYMRLFLLFVLLILPFALLIETSASPIGIMIFLFGFSFLAPLYYNVKGIIYREIFGVQVNKQTAKMLNIHPKKSN